MAERARTVTSPTEAAQAYRHLVTGRTCGECRVCCKLPDIEALGKPINTWCKHADLKRAGGGCGIYDKRPQTCREFSCAWLSGLGEDRDRPDHLGVMYQVVEMPDGRSGLGVVEYREGALESHRVRAQIEQFEKTKPGRVVIRKAAEARFRAVELTVGGKATSPAGDPAKKPSLVELAEPKPTTPPAKVPAKVPAKKTGGPAGPKPEVVTPAERMRRLMTAGRV